MKEKIEKFVDDVIKKNDFELLDILWTFSYSTQETSKSGYWYKSSIRDTFKKGLRIVCKRNLTKKHGLNSSRITEKLGVSMRGLHNTIPNFLSYDSYDEDVLLLRNILTDKSYKILLQTIEVNLQRASNTDKKILSFILNLIPVRIQDSIKKAEVDRQKGGYDWGKYAPLSDFNIKTDEETGDIVYFTIDPKEWTYIFNLLFDEELKEYRSRTKSPKRSVGFIFPPLEQHEEYSFWEFGDELVKIGIGYWVLYVSASDNLEMKFIIPNFIYEDLKIYKEHLPIVDNFIDGIDEIKKEKETKKVEEEWSLEETEAVSEVLESEIEASIISNPEILEEGLELIGNQYATSVGRIDILCRDKDRNFVVIELKRGTGTHKVVGQIQKYMAWVIENLAKDKQVRGIIVVREYDKGLEYAIKGSKFSIAIKKFGQEPPTEENIKYCNRCGKPNRKSAKYCIKCGQEFWME